VNGKQRWSPPGWPWELELLALVFVIIAIAVPYYLKLAQPPPDMSNQSLLAQAQAQTLRSQEMSTWEDLQGFFWAVIVVGLYLAHLAMGAASIDYMSTPFTHLFAPLLFAAITYGRLYSLNAGASSSSYIVRGALWEIVAWMGGVAIITYLVARIRMARLMLAFRDIDWKISTPSFKDSTYWQLVFQVRPLIYPPRWLRACDEGILIEGWFYAMPLAFDNIHAVDAVQGAALYTRGYCLATSMNSMVRIQVADRTEPILVSPKDRGAFVRYTQEHLALRSPPVALRSSDTGKGTKPGTTGKGTRPGVVRSHKTTHSASADRPAPQKIVPPPA
jgi:hypothetical protein